MLSPSEDREISKFTNDLEDLLDALNGGQSRTTGSNTQGQCNISLFGEKDLKVFPQRQALKQASTRRNLQDNIPWQSSERAPPADRPIQINSLAGQHSTVQTTDLPSLTVRSPSHRATERGDTAPDGRPQIPSHRPPVGRRDSPWVGARRTQLAFL